MYITPAKTCVSANMARFEPYMWASCEEEKGNVGWKKGSLARANGVTILGKGENTPSMDT